MDCLRLWRSVVARSTEVLGHTDRRGVTCLFALLTDGMLARAAFGDCVLITATAVALSTQGLPLVFLGFAIAGARGTSADVHGIGVSGVLLERGGLVRAGGF